jgi:hypothetical protein
MLGGKRVLRNLFSCTGEMRDGLSGDRHKRPHWRHPDAWLIIRTRDVDQIRSLASFAILHQFFRLWWSDGCVALHVWRVRKVCIHRARGVGEKMFSF